MGAAASPKLTFFRSRNREAIDGLGFEIGRVYNRRLDIHARFGGQQQGGIITPAQHPLVIIITGEEGLEHGYADRYRAECRALATGMIGTFNQRVTVTGAAADRPSAPQLESRLRVRSWP